MANEARVSASMTITLGNNQYSSRPTSFQANVSQWIGPTPGYLLAAQSGTVVSLSALATPGLCRIMNVDATNTLEIGPYDPVSNLFLPFQELLPGESYVVRLSRFLGQEMGTGTSGTGSVGSGVQFMAKGVGGACQALVEAFNV